MDIVRAVSMHDGLTTIGDIDATSRSIVRDKLYTLGELMRGNQITPANAPEGHISGGIPQAHRAVGASSQERVPADGYRADQDYFNRIYPRPHRP